MADKSQTRKNDTLGTIVLDYANGGATQSGRTFRLAPLEFRLLQVAAAAPQSKPTIEDLKNIDWPAGVEKSSGAVESAIKQLRKKFDPSGKLIFPHLSSMGSSPGLRPNRPHLPGGQWQTQGSKSDALLGTVFNGKYEIIEPIGGGTSGLVYRGRHIVLDKSLAIKVLHLNAITQSDLVRRFQREARLTAQLSHINIVGVSDFGLAEQGAPYLVMELVDGTSLAELLLREGRPPLADVINIFSQACAGLDHAHNKGFIHRDIKPSNLMLARASAGIKQHVKIVDFGLARSAEVNQGVSKITQTGVVVGSPHYMSPRAVSGRGGGPTHGRLFTRLRPLRNTDRPPTIHRPRCRGHLGDARNGSAS